MSKLVCFKFISLSNIRLENAFLYSILFALRCGITLTLALVPVRPWVFVFVWTTAFPVSFPSRTCQIRQSSIRLNVFNQARKIHKLTFSIPKKALNVNRFKVMPTVGEFLTLLHNVFNQSVHRPGHHLPNHQNPHRKNGSRLRLQILCTYGKHIVMNIFGA